jgi:LuxR family maltose regulon positive regulatory protein
LAHPPLTVRGNYFVVEQKTPETSLPLEVGSAEWFAWLERVKTFFFRDAEHPFTARKQLRSGHWYWYAQRRHNGRLRSVYIGKTADLTLERLHSVAQTLMAKEGHAGAPCAVQEQGDPLPASNGRGKGAPPLLAARLAIPRMRPTWVLRSRARDSFRHVLEHPLTLVCAPNGFGKTTLLAQWASLASPSVAWISLDESESDPVRFWAAVFSALDRLVPGVKRQVVKSASSSGLTQNLALTALLKTVTGIQHPILLMLDNYSVLQETGTSIHEGITFLAEHAPAHVHLVLAGRRDPPLPLARLRAHGVLYELRVAELRFTSEETAEFLAKQMGARLTAQEVGTLHARTEGWVVGLQLAAQALKGEANLSSAIANFTGEHPYIVDFLSEEVLNKLPAAIQQFLLETSVLSQLNGALCEAVTGVSNSQEVLETLAQAGLFLLPADEQPQSYRFHPLFAEVLRLRLQQGQPEHVPELRLRASAWYEEQGNLAEAIEYAFAGGDLVRAARLLEESTEEWLGSGAQAGLQRWLRRLPDELISRWPHLCVAQAQLLLAGGQFESFTHRMQEIDHHLKYTRGWYNQEEHTLLESEFLALRATRAALEGRLLQSVAWGAQAVAALPEKHSLRYLALLTLGNTFWLVGDTQAAGQTLEDACKVSETQDAASLYFASIPSLALVLLLQGRLRAAQELCQQAVARAERSGNALERQNAALALGMALYERNELDAAEAALERSIRLRPTNHPVLLLTVGYPTLAFIRQAQGDAAGALQLMEQARMELEEQWPWALNILRAQQARLSVVQGHLAAANAWRDNVQRKQHDGQGSLQQGFVDLWEQEQLILAYLSLAQGHPQEALKIVTRQRQQARAAGRMGRVVACLVLEAAAYESARLTASALQALEQALVLGEPEGFVRTFLLGAAPVQRLLRLVYVAKKGLPQAESCKFSTRYLETLLTAFQREEPGWTPTARGPTAPALTAGRVRVRPLPVAPLVEPLSEREQEILRFVGQGASNQEIAQRLAIALSTVKRHLSNIYGKLGVRSRTQALALVQSLHLLGKARPD